MMHRRHRHGWGRGNPLLLYFRMRMHRRIFAWFGASILVTMAVAGLVMGLSGGGESWRTSVQRVERFGGDRFSRVWDDPSAREELALAMVRDLDVGVTMQDARTGTAAAYGTVCKRSDFTADVMRDGARLGSVQICYGTHHGSHWPFFVPLLIAALVLWAASGRIARRLTRPLAELTRVTQEIGAGNLKARAQVDPFRHGEAGILGEAINDMATRIERQMADQRELLAAVSHELRTPLARIRLIAELVRGGSLGPKTLDDLDREVMEIDALVGDLLASSRMDFSALTLHRLDAVTVARRALERAAVSAEKLAVEGPLDMQVDGDATLLARALANLLENAQRHGGGVVAASVKAREAWVSFEVDDAGPGFKQGEEALAFDGFYHRPRDPERDVGGLGLGLSLVKRIAEAHGGRAYALQREGGGARVGFELKRATPS